MFGVGPVGDDGGVPSDHSAFCGIRITYYWTLRKSQMLKKYVNIYMLGHGKATILSKISPPLQPRFKPRGGIRFMWMLEGSMKMKVYCRDRSPDSFYILYLI